MKERLFVLTFSILVVINNTESSIPCNTAYHFLCANNECVSSRERCDFKFDCKDKSDEIGCPEPPICDNSTQFTCKNKKCIDKSWICDGEDNCFDESDETGDLCDGYQHKCSSDEYQCRATTDCIPQTYKCDGDIDCDNEDDEEGCPPERKCRSDEFMCANKECIDLPYRCDGDEDCKDGSDEVKCTNIICKDTELMCDSKTHCIDYSAKCDGMSDCPDESDEKNCTYAGSKCSSDKMFSCHSDGHCIPNRWKCNGEEECSDGSDEFHCDNKVDSCSFGEFRCMNRRQCVAKHRRCDGVWDCIDKSDEESCKNPKNSSTCPVGHFRCPGTEDKCILEHRLCDEHDDCPGAEDEKQGAHFCNYDECQHDNGNCSDTCIDQRLGYKCECLSGYQLGKDKQTCEDVNECMQRRCDRYCINSIGSYKCVCDHGYTLMHDGRTCKPVDLGHTVALIAGGRKRISKIVLDKGKQVDILFSDANQNSLAVDVGRDEVYWTDPINEIIVRSPISGLLRPRLSILKSPEVKSPASIKVDWLNRLIYWVDIAYETVSVAKQDGSFPKTLYSAKNVISIAIHPAYGYLFIGYGEFSGNKSARIERCGMNGEVISCKTIVSHQISYPMDMNIDYDQDLLYWTDGRLNVVASCDLAGEERMNLVSDVVHKPYSVAVFYGKVYWWDSKERILFSMNRTGGDLNIVVSSAGFQMNIAILQKDAQKSGTDVNVCAGSPCKYLCLPREISDDGDAKKYSCVCPDHFTVKEDDENDCKLTASSATSTTTRSTSKLSSISTLKSSTTNKQEVTTATNTVVSSTLHSQHGMASGMQILVALSVIAIILLCGTLVWCILRLKKRKSARMSMNFNNPIYRKVNESIASSSSINGLTEPSPSTSAGDVSQPGEDTAGLILYEEVPDDTNPFSTSVQYNSGGSYFKVPNGRNEVNSSNHR